ncbi:SadB/YajI family lipoprotein [Intestinirhabdus alba]|jgi:hypothetical protein|uniref:Lipoprotein n=1 Tax=Intestinirhabdus alba TaxID=2899544 RepID=A0A6L6ICU4_9ENTR|nr:hypothetical protein [Intestinirhabdus alba]
MRGATYPYAIVTAEEISQMTRGYRRKVLAGSLLSLSACARQSDVRQMRQSLSALNGEMQQLRLCPLTRRGVDAEPEARDQA